MPGFLRTFRDRGFRNRMQQHDFNGTAFFSPWGDAENDKLSSFEFQLPTGFDLRIHEHRSGTSRCKVWRGDGTLQRIDEAGLPDFLRDRASGHSWVKLGFTKIDGAFRALQPEGAANLAFRLGPGQQVPDGARGGLTWHQQGIQRLPNGGWVVTGSSPSTGYLYCTDANGTVTSVHTPSVGNFNHLGGCQVADGILAVGYERFENGSSGTSTVLFFDVRSGSAVPMPHLSLPRPAANSTGGAVGLVKLTDCWILLVANWNAERLDFYRSSGPDLFNAATRFDPQPRWQWSKAAQGFAGGSVDGNWGGYQNINLFVDPDAPSALDRLSFVGMHSSNANDWADLYTLDLRGGVPVVKKTAKLHVTNNDNGARLTYGGGLFFDPAVKAFELYAIEAHMSDAGTTRINRWL
jgi:hypothetical protein